MAATVQSARNGAGRPTRQVTISREDLVGIAHAERQRLGRMIQFAEPDSWDEPSAAAGWWNRDVMAHLAAADTAAAQLVAGQPAEELDTFRAQLNGQLFTTDAWNAWTVNRRSEMDTRVLLDTWGAAAESLLEHAVRMSEERWRDVRLPWLAGDIAPTYLVQSRVVEWFLHGEDMRATNGVGPGWQFGWQHWPVYLTIDLGVRMLPWALAEAGHDLSGRSVRIEVTGAGEGSWHWGLGAGEVPGPTSHPDATIVGRAPQLALVAGKRNVPETLLESGSRARRRSHHRRARPADDPRLPLGLAPNDHAPHLSRHRAEPVLVRVVALQQVEAVAPSSIASRMSSPTSTIPGASAPTTVERRVVEIERCAIGTRSCRPRAPVHLDEVQPETPSGRRPPPSRRKKISIPGTMNTPFGPSLRWCSSTNRSSSGSGPAPAVTIGTVPRPPRASGLPADLVAELRRQRPEVAVPRRRQVEERRDAVVVGRLLDREPTRRGGVAEQIPPPGVRRDPPQVGRRPLLAPAQRLPQRADERRLRIGVATGPR